MSRQNTIPIKLSEKDLLEVEEILDLQQSDLSMKNDYTPQIRQDSNKQKKINEEENDKKSIKITNNPSIQPISRSHQNNLNNIFSSFNNSSLLNSNSGGYKPIEQNKIGVSNNSSDIKFISSSGKESKNNELTNGNFNLQYYKNLGNKSNQNQNTNKNHRDSLGIEIPNQQTKNKSPIRQNLNIVEVSNQQFEPNSNISQSESTISQYHTIFKEFFYKEEKNSKYRNSMEDFSKIIPQFLDNSEMSFFSLYDGHGGSDPVKYVKDRMPELLSKLIKEKPYETLPNILINSFKKVDEELKFTDAENAGCTACISLLMVEKNKTILYTANVGDTRAVLFTDFSFSRLTQDHKCSDPSESERVKHEGGLIFNGRVFGQLVLTRALGDHAMKKMGVSPLPYINQTEINKDHRFLAIASDGVWDVISDDDMFRISLYCKTAEELATLIIETSLKKGSRDNISILIVKFN